MLFMDTDILMILLSTHLTSAGTLELPTSLEKWLPPSAAWSLLTGLCWDSALLSALFDALFLFVRLLKTNTQYNIVTPAFQ